MIQRFDHITVVVRDLDQARRFFGLLGFAEDKAVVIKGPVMDAYMGVPGIEADHVTLVLRGVMPRLEVQLLRYRHPEPLADPNIERLEKVGFNHVCFAVDDIEAEVARLRAQGIVVRNELMDFHSRKLIFLKGPEGITVELSEWGEPARLPASGGSG
jgi:catechol 2,3-dioxygenase-like lactoylglutathione lyase family enzyme